MKQRIINGPALRVFLDRLDAAFARPGRLYLVGETTQVYEGWRPWTSQIECTADVAPADRPAFDQALQNLSAETGYYVIESSPADIIPLPEGYQARARPALRPDTEPRTHLQVYHFDPYSVAFRFIARGDEPDYHLVLLYQERGWITWEEMQAHLQALLPRFTSETIQQDPAEFRRKYKGLLQMAQAIRARTIHRHTPA